MWRNGKQENGCLPINVLQMLLFLWALALTSCSGFSWAVLQSKEEALRQRVQLYWQAQQAGDVQRLRSLVDPDMAQSQAQRIERMARSPEASRILSWTLMDVAMEEMEATVRTTVTLEVRHPLLGPQGHVLKTVATDRWVFKRGRWFVVLEEPNLENLLMEYQKRSGKTETP